MDPKLRFKPIELLDIGIDKLTKIPIPILNDNIISTFDVDNELPSDSFVINFDANYNNKYFLINIASFDYSVNLSFNYGDESVIENILVPTGSTLIQHTYPSAITYTITVTGWLDKINKITSTTGGITSATLTSIRYLSELDLNNNRLTELSLNNLINLNRIILDNNYFPNNAIDDLYINADTYLTFNGYMSTIGVNNGKPSIYSDFAINSLKSYKGWTLNYNI